MADERLRELERTFKETGDSGDEIAYLGEVGRRGIVDSDNYQRARELFADNSIEWDKRQGLVDIVRSHGIGKVFEPLTDTELVSSMPLVNYFLDNDYSIYSTNNAKENENRPYPILVIRGDFQTCMDPIGPIVVGNIRDVLSDLETCLRAREDSILRTSKVMANNKEIGKIPVVYNSMCTIVNFRELRFHIEFLDNDSIKYTNDKNFKKDFEAANEHLNGLDRDEPGTLDDVNVYVRNDMTEEEWASGSNYNVTISNPEDSKEQDSEEENTGEDLFF